MSREDVKSRAVFLDKDGTLIENVPYNVDPEQIRFTHQAARALVVLLEAGYRLIVVSNQSGIARGRFTEADLAPVEHRLRQMFERHGVSLDGFFYCPHHPAGIVDRYSQPCLCRKPAPGMLISAAEALEVDLSQSWMIGDILDDVEAGRSAGCATVLIDNGNETEWKSGPLRKPHLIARDMLHAAHQILAVSVPASVKAVNEVWR